MRICVTVMCLAPPRAKKGLMKCHQATMRYSLNCKVVVKLTLPSYYAFCWFSKGEAVKNCISISYIYFHVYKCIRLIICNNKKKYNSKYNLIIVHEKILFSSLYHYNTLASVSFVFFMVEVGYGTWVVVGSFGE